MQKNGNLCPAREKPPRLYSAFASSSIPLLEKRRGVCYVPHKVSCHFQRAPIAIGAQQIVYSRGQLIEIVLINGATATGAQYVQTAGTKKSATDGPHCSLKA